MDEYQDTNPIQEQLIERLCRFGANLCVVGDDDQTIYSVAWQRGAEHPDFTERKAGVRTVTLDDNFRSTRGSSRSAETWPSGTTRTGCQGHGRRWKPDLSAR